MIILLLLMTICGLGHCLDQLPTQDEIQSSINRTISEVERLMKINTSLPQLSRSQIVDILYNITSKEVESLEESVERARSDYQRALMVVLPYNSRDAKNEDIKDLFTKPPMIQMIPDTETMLPFASIQAEQSPTEGVIDNLINVKYSSEINDELLGLENESDEHKTRLSDGEFDTKPEKFSFVLGKLEDLKSTASSSLQNHLTLNNILNNQNSSTIETKPTLAVFYQTETPVEKIMETTLKPIEDTKPTVPSTMSTNVLTYDQWKYFAPPATVSTPTTKKPVIKMTTKPSTTTIKSAKPLGIVNKPQPFIPTLFTTNPDDITFLTPSSSIKLTEETPKKPEFSSFDMRDYEMMNDESTGPIFVTPMPTESSEEDSVALPSLTTLVSVRPENQQKINNNRKPVNQKHEETLLESLGIDSKKNKLFIDPEKIDLTTHNELISLNSGVSENNNNLPNSLSKLTATGFDNSQINLKEGLSNLTPDVRLLFQRFGLQTSDKNKSTENHVSTTTKNPVQSIVKNSWSSFKPLPRSQVRDEGMRSFLAQFGLGVDNRREKSIRHDDSFKRQSIIEFVPGGMKSILENIGLIVKPRETTKKLTPRVEIKNVNNNTPRSQSIINKNINNSNLNKNTNNNIRRSDNIKNNNKSQPPTLNPVPSNHVFKPHETQISDQKQREKINELLDTVKLAQEGKAQVSDVQRIANDLLETAKTLKGGLDPVSLEEIIKIYHDDVKNEVKRENKAVDAVEKEKNGSLASSMTSTNTTTSEISKDEISPSTNTSDSVNQESIFNQTDSDAVGTDTDDNTKSVDTKTTTTEQSSSSTDDTNFNDLVDSFGGSTAEPDPALPAPRKSGLYFLLDWNSFLEVGEEGKDRVNLRLAPKVGDRSRFIPVVIP